jgi:acyl-CoA thioester hydrolase
MRNISQEIQVRFRDLDAYGHVNHAVYLSYLEVARTNLVREVFVRDMKRNIQYLLIEAHVKYIQPVLLNDKLIIDCTFTEAGKVKFKAEYKLHDGSGKIYATGYTEHALYDGNTRRPMRLTDELREFINGEG